MNILISSYAYDGTRGSEPGVGAALSRAISNEHEVTVMTRTKNQSYVESKINYIYHDLPLLANILKRNKLGDEIYYILWQLTGRSVIRRLVRQRYFDLGIHLTFGRFWSPTVFKGNEINYIIGPVGGAVIAPQVLIKSLDIRDRISENLRNIIVKVMIWLFNLQSDKNIKGFLVVNNETRQIIGSEAVYFPQVTYDTQQIESIIKISDASIKKGKPIIFMSVGRSEAWKGYSISIRAFIDAEIPDAIYKIVTPKETSGRLRQLIEALGVSDKVFLIDKLPNLTDIYKTMGEADVFVHPAIHESFGNVIVEAMLCNLPVIAYNVGGPAVIIDHTCGILIEPTEKHIEKMSDAMRYLANSLDNRVKLGKNGRIRAAKCFLSSEINHEIR